MGQFNIRYPPSALFSENMPMAAGNGCEKNIALIKLKYVSAHLLKCFIGAIKASQVFLGVAHEIMIKG